MINKIQTSPEELMAWLRNVVSKYISQPQAYIEDNVPLAHYGLDSVYVLTLAGEIEDHLGFEIEPTLMWDCPTIQELAQALWALKQERLVS